MNALNAAFYILIFLITLMGSFSVGPVSTFAIGKEEHRQMHEKVLKTFQEKLPLAFAHKAPAIADLIMSEYSIHKVDPMMITAIVSGESSFNPNAIGPVGELGLMQLRPRTGQWIAEKTGLPWKGKWALKDPLYNIQLGSAYLGYLKKKYSPKEGLLYLAAYNMGETSLMRLLSNKITPNVYSTHIMKNYVVISI